MRGSADGGKGLVVREKLGSWVLRREVLGGLKG